MHDEHGLPCVVMGLRLSDCTSARPGLFRQRWTGVHVIASSCNQQQLDVHSGVQALQMIGDEQCYRQNMSSFAALLLLASRPDTTARKVLKERIALTSVAGVLWIICRPTMQAKPAKNVNRPAILNVMSAHAPAADTTSPSVSVTYVLARWCWTRGSLQCHTYAS